MSDEFKKLCDSVEVWAKRGFKVPSVDQLRERFEKCRACPKFGGNKAPFVVWCEECNCTFIKLVFATSECPLGHWKAVLSGA